MFASTRTHWRSLISFPTSCSRLQVAPSVVPQIPPTPEKTLPPAAHARSVSKVSSARIGYAVESTGAFVNVCAASEVLYTQPATVGEIEPPPVKPIPFWWIEFGPSKIAVVPW